MKDYYQNKLEEITLLINQNQLDEAYQIIDEELRMPYIPDNFEKELKDLLPLFNTLKVERLINDPRELGELLSGDDDRTLLAITNLNKLNCRNYLDLIENFFISDSRFIFKSLILDILINQDLNYVIKLIKDGETLEINPSALTSVNCSEGFIYCENKLNELLSDDNLGELAISYELLALVGYQVLPSEITKDDYLYKAIIFKVNNMFGNKENLTKDYYDCYLKYRKILDNIS